jgi:copper chaperone CopZ
MKTTYEVSGMTCAHCAAAVSGELGRLAGVRTVEVDVPAGLVTVDADGPLDLALVRAAVDEAGYELTSQR